MRARIKSMLVAVAATGAVAAVAPTAEAMTIRIGDATLTGRVAISVPLLVSCNPFDPAFTGYFARRAQSRRVSGRRWWGAAASA